MYTRTSARGRDSDLQGQREVDGPAPVPGVRGGWSRKQRGLTNLNVSGGTSWRSQTGRCKPTVGIMPIARNQQLLFNESDVFDLVRRGEEQLRADIERYDQNKLLNASIEDLVRYFAERAAFSPIMLNEDKIAVDQSETTLPRRQAGDNWDPFEDNRVVSASAFTYVIPFDGDGELFRYKPNTFTLNPPRGAVRGQELHVTIATADPSATEVRQEFDREFRELKNYLGHQRSQLEAANQQYLGLARQAVETRRARLLQRGDTAAALGYPLRKREGTPTTYAPPTVKRKLVAPPVASSEAFKPEPALPGADYEHILKVITSMALVLEQSPSAFETMGEEALRQHFLVHLNGHYEGGATGETFNVEGKTDILIRVDGKNIFIGECKFWKGLAGLTATIDQLLSYTSWRDTKTAIIIFVRDVAMSTVVPKVPEGLMTHQQFKRMVREEPDKASFRAIFGHKNDPSREVTVTVLAFDVPGSKTKK